MAGRKKLKRSSSRDNAKKARRNERRERQSHSTGEETVVPETLPVLPAKDLVAFPGVMVSLHVARASSAKAIEASTKRHKLLFIVSEKDPDKATPQIEDLYQMGVVANVVRTLVLPDGRYKVLLQGIVRAQAMRYSLRGEYFVAKVKAIHPPERLELSAEDEGIINRIRENLQIMVEYEHLPEEMLVATENVTDPGILSDIVIAHYKLDPAFAQRILEELDPLKRLRLTDSVITDDLNQFLLSERIRNQTKVELTKGQKEYYLREQIKQIQRELGEQEGGGEELEALKRKLDDAKLPQLALDEAMKQLRRLERMSPEASEYALLRTYLEWVADLPWSVTTKDRLDLKRAKGILDADHFGLEKAKERIMEYLAVRKLNATSKGTILCFVGPPGVGKTSLGRSIAHALDRKFFRMSLGGVRDEAEIRGHRRTYVGALPGRIIQGLKQTESRNAVFVLDELDKVGTDFRGDPASALLEVLDPEQNKEFRDHYLNIPFDLSSIIFVATANTTDTIPEALLDRLEIISIPGYTTEEKLHIARRYLVPRQLKENGLDKLRLHFDDRALLFLVERYTREAGVRNLEREIGSLCRKIARQYAGKARVPTRITVEVVRQFLGTTKFDPETSEERDAVGLVRGLAWTIHGGEVMPVEASLAKGTGKLTLTGQLGSVMQESAQAALFFARSNTEVLGISPDFHERLDIHIHVPSGATPKDGPSAGITIATALVSVLTQRKVSRQVAMTGEVTLRGNVLPVGGLKEKALAALRHGIRKVIIPFENMKDIQDIPKDQREQIKFIPVKHIAEVLEIALLPQSAGARARSDKKTARKPSVSAEA